ncbi:MAG: hypothetical protein IJV40_06370 [Oscillospiraceae bacterium]|nr:hypothetical protein [Oscillospiraceae bacterium]
MKKTANDRHEAALRMFMSYQSQILETLQELTDLAEDHFGKDPDSINYADAAELDYIRGELNNILRFAKNEEA